MNPGQRLRKRPCGIVSDFSSDEEEDFQNLSEEEQKKKMEKKRKEMDGFYGLLSSL
jgi:hypothetical protein